MPTRSKTLSALILPSLCADCSLQQQTCTFPAWQTYCCSPNAHCCAVIHHTPAYPRQAPQQTSYPSSYVAHEQSAQVQAAERRTLMTQTTPQSASSIQGPQSWPREHSNMPNNLSKTTRSRQATTRQKDTAQQPWEMQPTNQMHAGLTLQADQRTVRYGSSRAPAHTMPDTKHISLGKSCTASNGPSNHSRASDNREQGKLPGPMNSIGRQRPTHGYDLQGSATEAHTPAVLMLCWR